MLHGMDSALRIARAQDTSRSVPPATLWRALLKVGLQVRNLGRHLGPRESTIA